MIMVMKMMMDEVIRFWFKKVYTCMTGFGYLAGP